MAKKKASKQKKLNVRVDFTPMVDMMMLLITFFMLCTSLSKPQAMQLTMPSNDDNMTDEDKSQTKASHTITVILGPDDRIFYIKGLPNYEDPSCVVESSWGSQGIRQVFLNHYTEEGINPVANVLKAKAELDEKKLDLEHPISDEAYQKELSEIKNGNINGEKIPVLTVIIKPMDSANYKNMVEALDEMQICCISKYVIDKITPEDEQLLADKGIK